MPNYKTLCKSWSSFLGNPFEQKKGQYVYLNGHEWVKMW